MICGRWGLNLLTKKIRNKVGIGDSYAQAYVNKTLKIKQKI